MTQQNDIVKKESDLIHRVFGTDDGQRLLKHWSNIHIVNPIADPNNPYGTFFKLGQTKFITDILYTMENPDD